MPSRSVHVQFDEYLAEHRIISHWDYSTVHDRMDKDLQIYGHWNHRYEDFYHDIDGIREWIRSWSHLAYPETKTDYVRVALGHLVLDEIKSRQEWEDEYDLIKRAYRSFIARGFDLCYFKE